ncbi:MAG: YggS family pyridoxal phosphate-dependent enzyme [Muribaculaceae bacterium]|nr:YggS family pyridoxal phosphate-dependent enzyme [Muribaculaceae bacterium]
MEQHITATTADLIRQLSADGVQLVAVSKFHPAQAVMAAYRAGQRDFGESRAAELVGKATQLPDDIRWHFIGHLQTNKVRMIMPHVSMIQSVDSERLLRLIDSEARRIGRTVDILLQIHVAIEETKTGFTADELLALLTTLSPGQLPGVRVRGIMGMASNTDDTDRIRADFQAIHDTFQAIRNTPYLSGQPCCDTISMGMSHDYPTAISCGSTMVRIGTTIFGQREY